MHSPIRTNTHTYTHVHMHMHTHIRTHAHTHWRVEHTPEHTQYTHLRPQQPKKEEPKAQEEPKKEEPQAQRPLDEPPLVPNQPIQVGWARLEGGFVMVQHGCPTYKTSQSLQVGRAGKT